MKKERTSIRMIVTGANGHLGNNILRLLEGRNVHVDAMVRPGEKYCNHDNISYFEADVRDIEAMRPFFRKSEDERLYAIHTAGIIDITEKGLPDTRSVNIGGTENIIELCMENNVDRLVHVSSVHAIPERKKGEVITEVDSFNPELVRGAYAKSKAEATEKVLEAARHGLDAVVVHPSGIIGPYDQSGNHLVQMLTDYVKGILPAAVKGGYDFVDVRDVAYGCLEAMLFGRKGECYLLTGEHLEIGSMLEMARKITGGRKLVLLPIWIARIASPMMQLIARRRRERPLFTSYSLHTLETGSLFSHEKATAELGYATRPMSETIRDTILWYSKPRVKTGRKLSKKIEERNKVTRSLRKKAWSPCYIL